MPFQTLLTYLLQYMCHMLRTQVPFMCMHFIEVNDHTIGNNVVCTFKYILVYSIFLEMPKMVIHFSFGRIWRTLLI